MTKRILKPSPTDPIRYTIISTPLGLTGIAGSPRGLSKIILKLPGESDFKKYLQKSHLGNFVSDPPFFENIVKQLNLYFAGKLKSFTCRMDLTGGTPFQQTVWRQLSTIPYGKTHSYRTLAEAIAHPQAFRAVGNANGKNPLPLIIPCHRVIRENGALGGYTGGLSIKKFLLDLEST
ncbi:MAG: methylated-DNA--[protein]-cysteine S-methyltransferase [Nitrospinae bacterium]|jgi:O-6-methylguanine DNA methyltransferase|nr:methylated-DNA--[protein]-cysteine S-methyltransferase [Nitrospinota bacterium]MDA1108237.1 methylated-DNA--[protein]-cysteine S-methyltransferase [Nitrospinota bacterium]